MNQLNKALHTVNNEAKKLMTENNRLKSGLFDQKPLLPETQRLREENLSLRKSQEAWFSKPLCLYLGFAVGFMFGVYVGKAHAHDAWLTGEPVPEWVKAECCGKADAHHLRLSAVHIMTDGLHIDGIKTIVPMSRLLPSPDGNVWIFWNPVGEPEPVIFCAFYPFSGT